MVFASSSKEGHIAGHWYVGHVVIVGRCDNTQREYCVVLCALRAVYMPQRPRGHERNGPSSSKTTPFESADYAAELRVKIIVDKRG